jgi:hypothetical protein
LLIRGNGANLGGTDLGIRQRCWTIAFYLLCLSDFQITNAKAIVLASADSAANTPDSRTGLPLNHIGIVNNDESGVYLGDYHGESWVLTANHSGPGSFELGGIIYNVVAGSAHQLLNPDSTPSDILLFQIDALSGLPYQPVGTSVLNHSINVIADLSQYRAQIDAILSLRVR